MSDYALCRDCHELDRGRHDASKGWQLDQSSYHFGHRVTPLTDFATMPAPIKATILRLGAGLHITNTHITMLKLGFDLEEAWTPSPSTAPAVGSVSMRSPAPALASDASTRSRPACPPTSTIGASEPDLLDLLGGETA